MPAPDGPNAFLQRHRLPAVLLLAIVIGGVLAVSNVWAQPGNVANPAGKLLDVEKQLEQEREKQAAASRDAEAVRAEVERLRRQTIEAARQTQEAEGAIARLEKRRQEIGRLVAERTGSLQARRAQLAALLAALERLANRPPEALLAQPAAPDDTVRAAILLRAAIPRIEQAAAQLKIEIEDLAALHEQARRNAEQLRSAAAALRQEQEQLNAMLDEKSRLERDRLSAAQAGAREAQRLAGQARDLRDLVERLESERKKREEAAQRAREAAGRDGRAVQPPREFKPAGFMTVPFSATRGRLPLPVRGTVAQRFGDPGAQGEPARGILIATGPGAQVVAPYDGLVVYAGAFRGYGQLLIIETGEGYHFLLAGLARVDGVVGQWVLAGEPVGMMGNAGKSSQQLYIELRRQGIPIDPLLWLVADKHKVG